MNSDIRLQLSFRNHPKTKKLSFKLGPQAVLSFIWLMMFAAESRADGDLTGYDAEDLALAGSWPDDPDLFVDTLVAVGYLDPIAGGYQIHNWAERNPWAAGAPERSAKASKAARKRWDKADEGTGKQGVKAKKHAPSKVKQCGADAGSNAPTPSPSPSPKPYSPVVELPAWIEREIWKEYEDHRREIKYVLTPTAARRILIKLGRFREQHPDLDPNRAIEITMESSYRGVFPEKILEEVEREKTRASRGSRGPASSQRTQAADRARDRVLQSVN
jgi:hypothetical protein